MTIFYTSDTHFNHENIIKYCDRPFKNADHMNAVLIENWNRVVTPKDTVYHLGDFALGERDAAAKMLGQLNGYKVLIHGNHDWSPVAMKTMGFNAVRRRMEFISHGYTLALAHHPVTFGVDAETQFKNTLVLCGHVHQAWETNRLADGRVQVNVGVDVWAFTPVHLKQIIERANAAETNEAQEL